METSKIILDIIKSVVGNYLIDAEVMLFGSRARIDSNTESDFDILIVTSMDLSHQEKTPLRTQIRKDLLRDGVRSDILIQSEKEIERKKKLPGHFIRNILKEAVIL